MDHLALDRCSFFISIRHFLCGSSIPICLLLVRTVAAVTKVKAVSIGPLSDDDSETNLRLRVRVTGGPRAVSEVFGSSTCAFIQSSFVAQNKD